MATLKRRGELAIVGGAGIAGLSAAAALAPYFDKVVVYEKDVLTDQAEVRPSCIQGGHIHTLLRGGEIGLERLMPGLRDVFVADGAVELDMGQDYIGYDAGVKRDQKFLDLPVLMMSRPGYELSIRKRLQQFENVEIVSGWKVDHFNFEGGKAKSATISSGEARQDVVADFLVDCRGRGSTLPSELNAAGFGKSPESVLGIVMCYVSGRFKRQAEHAETKTAILVRPQPPEVHYGIVSPVEGGDWMVSLGGRQDVVPPTDLDGFLQYARDLSAPDLYELIKDCELRSPLVRYKKPTSNWRHYDRMEDFPVGLAPLGDTITSVNPTFGQGMTLAVFHALALADTLVEQGIDDTDFAAAYFRRAMVASTSAWQTAGFADMEYPFVVGERPSNFDEYRAFNKGLRMVAAEDPEIQRLLMQVYHMERPGDVLRDPGLTSRITEKMANG